MSLPSVTQILRAVGLSSTYAGVPKEVLEHARLRGQGLHLAIQYHHEGTLDAESLHPEIQPGFRAYLDFLADTGHRAMVSEPELIHPAWQYIGHPDRVGWLGKDRVILDWKHVAKVDLKAGRLQLAAYRMAWNALHPTEPVSRCFLVHLATNSDGKARLHDVTDPGADQIFLAALVVFRELQRRQP